MNKWTRMLCAGAALAAALTVSAFAADFTECAEHLDDMGLFRGTEQGYELDRAPTRAEAAAMLVRLLGKEEEAGRLAYDAPFTDLQEWEKPYVQYLYENGLTTGATETTFEPEEQCTAQMYAAFLLRALGYTEADGDFVYADSSRFASRIGLYDPATVNEADFLRDHVAAASYTALSISPKGTDDTLLARLAAAGAVEEPAAAPYQELFQAYNRYLDATSKMDGLTALSVGQELRVDAGTFVMTCEEQTAIDLGAPAMLTDRTVTLSAEQAGEKTFTAESYTANGFRYLRQEGTKSRRALTNGQMQLAFEGYARVPVALIDSVSVSGQSYTIGYNQAGLARLDSVLEAAQSAVGALGDLEIEGFTVVQEASDGLIQAQEVRFGFAADGISGQVESRMTLQGVDNQVTVSAPANLEQYPLVK